MTATIQPRGIGYERARDHLRPCEERVVALVVQGHANKEIAAQLGLTESTVKKYLGDVLRMVGLQTRCELIVAFYRGQIQLGEQR